MHKTTYQLQSNSYKRTETNISIATHENCRTDTTTHREEANLKNNTQTRIERKTKTQNKILHSTYYNL